MPFPHPSGNSRSSYWIRSEPPRGSHPPVAEDVEAETDMNVVMNDAGAFIELQGTAEGHAFRRDELDRMLELAATGVSSIMEAQRRVLDEWRATRR